MRFVVLSIPVLSLIAALAQGLYPKGTIPRAVRDPRCQVMLKTIQEASRRRAHQGPSEVRAVRPRQTLAFHHR